MANCDGFNWPVGDPADPGDHWPGAWYDATGYAVSYQIKPGIFNYHTGADLNLAQDKDAHAPMYAVANGTVVYSRLYSTAAWGQIVVIRHTWPDGRTIYSRYGHVEKRLVNVGDDVTKGQQIASVGSGEGLFPYHLHFDISPTNILETQPQHWPGLDRNGVLTHYVDPLLYIRSHREAPVNDGSGTKMTVVSPTGLRLRAEPTTAAATLRILPKGGEVLGFEQRDGGGYTWRLVQALDTGDRGWMAERDASTVYLSVLVPPVTDDPAVGDHLITNVALRVRSAPNGAIRGTLRYGTTVTVMGSSSKAGGYDWLPIASPSLSGFAAWRTTDKSTVYLVPKVDGPPPPTAPSKLGVHVHGGQTRPNEVHAALLAMASAGKLSCAVITNDRGLANALVARGVPYVVYRDVLGVGDSHPGLTGTQADEDTGYKWWHTDINQQSVAQLDNRIIIQPYGCNERNVPRDGYFYLGMMKAADEQGRKVGIFGNSDGHPIDVHEEQGKWVSEDWQHRIDSNCMAYGKSHGHYLVYHGYGRMTKEGKETDDPGSELWFDDAGQIFHRDDAAWEWYGGRLERIYRDIIPEASRMNIILGETGPSDATYRGPRQVTDDMKGYKLRMASFPYYKGMAFWTFGGSHGWGFPYSTMDEAAEAIRDFIIAQ